MRQERMVWETTVRVETREDTTNREPTVYVDGRGAWEEGRSWASLLGLRSNPLDLDNIAYNRQGRCARNRFGWRVYVCVSEGSSKS